MVTTRYGCSANVDSKVELPVWLKCLGYGYSSDSVAISKALYVKI